MMLGQVQSRIRCLIMESLGSAGGKTQHPLPKTERPRVYVDQATLEQWKADALDDIGAVLLDNESWFYRFDEYLEHHAYKVLHVKPDVRGGGREYPPGSRTVDFLCRVQLDLTLEDVVLALHSKSNLEQRLAFAQIYQDIVLDAGLIELFEGETEEDPFHSVSVKWIVFDSPVRQILRYRDCLYFEFCFTAYDALGRRVLVDYRKSKDLLPDQLRDHGLDILRSPVAMLTTYHMEGDNVISQVHGIMEPNGSVKSWVSLNYLPIVFNRLLNIKGLSLSKALLRAGVRASGLAKRQSSASSDCHSCRRKFGITSRKAWCRACGRTVCRRCTCKLILPVAGYQIAPALPIVRTRFCRGCIVFALSQTAEFCESSSVRPKRNSDISCVGNDSFFGVLGDKPRCSSSLDLMTVLSAPTPTNTPAISASRLERMMARLSYNCDLQYKQSDSLTDVSSSSSRSSSQSIYADDGMRVFFPNAEPRESQ